LKKRPIVLRSLLIVGTPQVALPTREIAKTQTKKSLLSLFLRLSPFLPLSFLSLSISCTHRSLVQNIGLFCRAFLAKETYICREPHAHGHAHAHTLSASFSLSLSLSVSLSLSLSLSQLFSFCLSISRSPSYFLSLSLIRLLVFSRSLFLAPSLSFLG